MGAHQIGGSIHAPRYFMTARCHAGGELQRSEKTRQSRAL
jgi:hypothetical protein